MQQQQNKSDSCKCHCSPFPWVNTTKCECECPETNRCLTKESAFGCKNMNFKLAQIYGKYNQCTGTFEVAQCPAGNGFFNEFNGPNGDLTYPGSLCAKETIVASDFPKDIVEIPPHGMNVGSPSHSCNITSVQIPRTVKTIGE